jgi:tetratricopeptide (TPR) repeat protein
MSILNRSHPTEALLPVVLLFALLFAFSCGGAAPEEKTTGAADAVPPGTVRSSVSPPVAPPAGIPGVPADQVRTGGLEAGSDLAEMFIQAGELARTGLYDRALDRYRSILEERPEHVPTLVNAARIHFIQGRTEDAIDLLKEADRILPGHPRTLGYLGMAEVKAGRLEEALGHLEASQLADPSRIDVGNELAGVYFELERYDEAAEAWERVLRLDPENILARTGLEEVRRLGDQASPVPAPAPAP